MSSSVNERSQPEGSVLERKASLGWWVTLRDGVSAARLSRTTLSDAMRPAMTWSRRWFVRDSDGISFWPRWSSSHLVESDASTENIPWISKRFAPGSRTSRPLKDIDSFDSRFVRLKTNSRYVLKIRQNSHHKLEEYYFCKITTWPTKKGCSVNRL